LSKDGPIFEKFKVERTDGGHLPGRKHHGCFYWVLDVTHDPHARAALVTYEMACRLTHPQLADELRHLICELEGGSD